jgi:hypothetical protein
LKTRLEGDATGQALAVRLLGGSQSIVDATADPVKRDGRRSQRR